MPLPSPRQGEAKQTFISRCMGSEIMQEEYAQEQRSAVCYSKWSSKNNMKRTKFNKKAKEATKSSSMRIVNIKLNTNVEIQEQEFNGAAHMVVPVVMLTMGVHEGALGGKVFYPMETLSEFPRAWNGRPVTLGHPKSQDGYVAANDSPQVYDSFSIGQIFGAHYDSDKLKAQLWLNKEKIENRIPDFHDHIQNGLEVSTGLFSEDIEKSGIHNNEEYDTIAVNLSPDHLALLPGAKGACSWEDGCGVRVNQEGEAMNTKQIIMKALEEGTEIPEDCQGLNDKGFSFTPNEDMSFDEIGSDIRRQLYANDSETQDYYLIDIFERYFVYEKITRTGGPPDEQVTTNMYKQSYTVGDSGATFVEDPVEVRLKREYITLEKGDTNMKRTKKGEEETPRTMAECCPEKVDELIKANSKFNDEDKDKLLALNEDTFEMVVNAAAETEPETDDKDQDTKADPKQKANDGDPKGMGFDEIIANASPEVRESIQYGQTLAAQHRQTLVESIKANENCQFTDDELTAFDFQMLEKLAGSLGKKEEKKNGTNYLASFGAPAPNVYEADMPEPLPVGDEE